jgi:antirestriction protein ArdC
VIEPLQRIEHADRFFAATGADIRHGGDRAYYSGRSDHVQMPCVEAFRSGQAYYATLAHEVTHWTKQEARLDRNFAFKKWGDEAYAREAGGRTGGRISLR